MWKATAGSEVVREPVGPSVYDGGFEGPLHLVNAVLVGACRVTCKRFDSLVPSAARGSRDLRIEFAGIPIPVRQ